MIRGITTTTSSSVRTASASRALLPHRAESHNPPDDPENPRWEKPRVAIGNQYINEGKVFACNVEKGGFFYEMLAAQPRGTSDTSRIATDHIITRMQSMQIFLLAERNASKLPEKMAGGTLALPGEKERWPVAHVLKDGADSIGIPGQLFRVYVNIGMFPILADAAINLLIV